MADYKDVLVEMAKHSESDAIVAMARIAIAKNRIALDTLSSSAQKFSASLTPAVKALSESGYGPEAISNLCGQYNNILRSLMLMAVTLGINFGEDPDTFMDNTPEPTVHEECHA